MKNRKVVEMVDINKISCEVGRRKWNCLGHLLRREGVNDFFDTRISKGERETKDQLERDC